jgi:hypothetical protein
MNIVKNSIFYILFIINMLQIVAGGGCAPGSIGSGTRACNNDAQAQVAADMVPAGTAVPEQYAVSIGALAQSVDTLRERFMMMPGSRPVPAGLHGKWLRLNAEAERLGKAVHADGKLEYLLGELGRIGIFFNAPEAAHTAEYYLTECVGIGGGTGERDFRPYLSLAWLNLHRECQSSEKTRDLLAEAEKRAPDWELPYLSMLWGYYYYSCRHDLEKAMACFQTYLAFDPADDGVRKIYQSIKK